MAQAAAAAAVHLRRPFLLSLKPGHLFSSLAPRTPRLRQRALCPLGTSPANDPDDASDDGLNPETNAAKKSRNELKREARRAVRWGVELAKFPPPQIKRILKAASLEREVFDALMLVKTFGPDVREGRRRQFNYIGRLLRGAQPELMDTLIQASKDGDDSMLLNLLGKDTLLMEDDEAEDLTCEEEGNEEYMETATRWFDGLICKDTSITNEVYAVHNVKFDRQELRKLVRRVQMVHGGKPNDDDWEESMKLTRVKKPLLQFLRSLAKKAYVE